MRRFNEVLSGEMFRGSKIQGFKRKKAKRLIQSLESLILRLLYPYPLKRTVTLILIFTIYISTLFTSCKEAFGITTKFWTQTSQEDFNKGQINNISIYRSGEIALAPKIENFNGIDASYVWSMARDEYGNIFVGTGDPGKVYKLTEQKGAVEIFRLEDALHIQSLAIDHHGNIFAGISPNGVIYKIDRYMQTSLFCSLPERYIWDMVIDSSGNLFAATGDTGKIYKINGKGEASLFLDSPASHILGLEIDDKDVIYACTEPFGLVYRITPEGWSRVIFDADEDEVHCMTLGKDRNLYIGTAAGRKSMILPPIEASPPVFPTQPAPYLVEEEQDDFWFRSGSWLPSYSRKKVEDTKKIARFEQWLNAQYEMDNSGLLRRRRMSFQDESEMPQTAQKTMEGYCPIDGLTAAPNAVYMISQDGRVKKLLDLDRDFIFTITSDEANNIYAGTGKNATIYKIMPSLQGQDKGDDHDQTSILLRSQELHILSSLTSNGSLYAGTGNRGSVFKASNLFSTNGIYESPVYDTLVPSRWGRISWDASLDKGTRIILSTRVGNSRHVPDNTWSDWSKDYVDGNEAIEGPPGRFIQYRAILSTIYSNVTPILKDVSIAYLPANQPPNISRLEIGYNEELPLAGTSKDQADQEVDETLFPTSLTKRKSLIKTHSKKTIKWEANDPDNDRLLFDLYYKLIDKNEWKILSHGIYGQNTFEWETIRVRDGKYQIKIVASDHLDNPEKDSLTTEMISQPFIIDNTKPLIGDITVYKIKDERLQISGAVSDNISNITTIQYSVNHTDWVSIFTNDQIFDYSKEEFQFTLPELVNGEHTVTIDAIDQEGNVGSAEVDISLR